MTTLDLLYICLGVGFLVLVGFLSYAAYQIGKTAKESRNVIANASNITDDVRALKDSIKAGILRPVIGILRLIARK